MLVNLVGNSFQNHPLGYTSEIECSEIKKNFHNVRSRNCDCSPFKRSAEFRFVYVTLECKCWLAHELRFSTVANRSDSNMGSRTIASASPACRLPSAEKRYVGDPDRLRFARKGLASAPSSKVDIQFTIMYIKAFNDHYYGHYV